MTSRESHWQSVYRDKGDSQVSWTQAEPRLSLSLIDEVAPVGSVIDVGGGASSLTQRLLESGRGAPGRGALAVLDISAAALARAGSRMGESAARVRWITADVTAVADVGTFDVWHDRAVFHFLTQAPDRQRYVALLARTVPVGGHAIIATFAPDGPPTCSGLEVVRYDGAALAEQLGSAFELLRSVPETHVTPWGKLQPFQYGVFRRIG